jgi:hypothetical protein
MATMYDSRTISVRINRAPREVYDFVSNPEHLSQWAAGLGTGGRWEDGVWVANWEQGRLTVRFTERNELGVLDHYVRIGDGPEIYNPMRVVANGGGSEVSFTLFRRPEMSDATYAADGAQVERDLQTLKAELEG